MLKTRETEEFPDYCGEEGNKLRLQAQRIVEERSQLINESQQCYKNNEKGKAKELSEKSKILGLKIEEINKQAAEVILNYRNKGHDENYLDLHGLYLEEALKIFRERLELLQKKNLNYEIIFEVITGAGNHSKNKAVIKPKVIEELQIRKLRYEEKNAGTLSVYLPSSTGSKRTTISSNSNSNKYKSTMEESKTAESTPSTSSVGNKTTNSSESGKFGCCIII